MKADGGMKRFTPSTRNALYVSNMTQMETTQTGKTSFDVAKAN